MFLLSKREPSLKGFCSDHKYYFERHFELIQSFVICILLEHGHWPIITTSKNFRGFKLSEY